MYTSPEQQNGDVGGPHKLRDKVCGDTNIR
jgi:hypothetical protein